VDEASLHGGLVSPVLDYASLLQSTLHYGCCLGVRVRVGEWF
jgi:hypothetical protein